MKSKKTNELTLGEALELYMQESGMDNKMLAQQLIENWQVLVGQPIAEATEEILYENGYLYLKLKSPAWRTELFMARGKLKETINKYLEKKVVKEIKFI